MSVILKSLSFLSKIMKKNKDIRLIVYEKYDGHCAYCGCILDLNKFTIDHIEPKFRNYSDRELERYGRERGEDDVDNFNPSCKSCNSSKSTFTVEKWRKEINLKFERCKKYNYAFRLLFRFGMIKYNHDCVFYFEKHDRLIK